MFENDSSQPQATNAFELTVSELSNAIKGTIEDSFGHVRLRGEVSGYRGAHSSGHSYFSLKDANARIDAIIWKGVFGRLKYKPQEGLEIIATGRISTFPGKSSYQIIIDSIEPAGIGALMALLEERKQKFITEGLFDADKKLKIPFLPKVIGVITSPTGAVIRDILHRLEDRFPRPVLVWPVRVQGETSADEIASAIKGFNALKANGSIPRPDVLIVARGGGSIEDLWSFNEEAVVRAAFESKIPLISAVGHETDWTLLDYVADLRAPTPTGAAEMAVPVRAELMMAVHNFVRRQEDAMVRYLDIRRRDLRSLIRVFPQPDTLFALQHQKLDLSSVRLLPALRQNTQTLERRFLSCSQRLAHLAPKAQIATMRGRLISIATRPQDALKRHIDFARRDVEKLSERLTHARQIFLRQEKEQLARYHDRLQETSSRMDSVMHESLARKSHRFVSSTQLFESLNYKTVLKRGYALVRDSSGSPMRSVSNISHPMPISIELYDGSFEAMTGTMQKNKVPSPKDKAKKPTSQGNLFE